MRTISVLPLVFALSVASGEDHGAAPAKEAAHQNAAAEESTSGLAVRSAKQSSRDVKVPRALVTRLEKEYREYLKHNQWPDQESLKRKLLDVSVELRQERPAALHEDVRINTPLGGGIVDLAEFVTPLRGAFHLLIKPRAEKNEVLEGLRVFFVSHGKERRIDGEDFGAGCGKFMEVTSFFNKKMDGSGFDLYTAEQRYVSVVGGIFVMAAFSREALQVGSVSFTDSRFPELICE